MAVDDWGDKNEPIFLASGAPEIDVDPTAVAAYAAKVGNRRVGTNAQRLAATGKDIWPGLFWQETDGNLDGYLRTGSGWVLLTRPRQTTAGLAYASGYGNNTEMTIARANGIVVANFSISKVTPFTDGDEPGTVPAGFRPTKTIRKTGAFWGAGFAPGLLQILIDGKVTVYGSPGANPNFQTDLVYEHG